MADAIVNAGVSAAASEVAKSFYDIIQQNILYMFKYKSYVKELRSQVVGLTNKRQRLAHTVKDAENQGDEIYEDVQQWMSKVTDFIELVEKSIEGEEDNAKKKRCIKGLCPNLMTRYILGKQAVKTAKDAADLLTKGNFSTVSYRPAPERTEFNSDVREYHQFDSRMKVFQDVMEALKDSKVNMIGVYGIGGVGKTTFVKQVAEKMMKDKLFDEVVLVEVTQAPDLKIIQEKIARDLGLTFPQHESSSFQRADQLRRRLKKMNRVLIVLDNIWAKQDLQDIGIPFGYDNIGERKGGQRRCTMLMTSRSRHVLSNEMNSQKNFLLEVLCKDEAMSLFCKIVGDPFAESSDFQTLAVDIVTKCGGLPVAISTIATALKHKSLSDWKDALNQLNNSNPTKIQGMDKNVYSSIKLSYDILENDEAKAIFRLCGLRNSSRMPINDLLRYGIGLGLFSNVRSMEAGRHRVHALVNTLKDSCLLLDSSSKDAIRMHDIIHAVAVSIAEDELMFNIENADDSAEDLKNVVQKNPTAISLPFRKVYQLPGRLECPKLKLFMLLEAEHSVEIPDLFFDGMAELRVLDLTGCRLHSLPSSFRFLVNLRTLCLEYQSEDVDIAIVGELKNLEIFSLLQTRTKRLPGEIGQLTKLKVLDLGNCSNLEVIAPNVISKLSRLEELYMGNSFTKWKEVGEESNASLVELKELSKLSTLEIHIPDAQIMLKDLVSVELERFTIFIGNPWHWVSRWNKYEISRTLKINGLKKNSYSVNGMKTLLNRSEELYLEKLNGFQNVVHELNDGEGFPQLKQLCVQNDPEILYIVNSAGRVRRSIFLSLETLFLSDLIKLEMVCRDQLKECQSFSKLRVIKVEKCHALKQLFSFSMAKNLLQLQEIEVTDCRNLKMIVGEESENHIVHENESIDFIQLHSLTLRDLPQLTSSRFKVEISQSLSETSSASKEIVVEDDPEHIVTVLFNNAVIFPTLEKLELYSLSIQMIWLDQFSAMATCQNLTKLKVGKCRRLKFLFSYSMVNSLVQLQELVIQGCELMERIIDATELGRDDEKMIESLAFPKLDHLEFSYLPKLTRFISRSSSEEDNIPHIDTDTKPLFDYKKVAFSGLRTLKVSNCDGLRNLMTLSTAKSLKKLTSVKIVDCKMIEKIMEMNVGEDQVKDPIVFCQLEDLELNCLPRLGSFYSGDYTIEFPYLEHVVVSRCANMKIFSQGNLSTPNLHKVYLTEGIGWEGDLNSTIKNCSKKWFKFHRFSFLLLLYPCFLAILFARTGKKKLSN